MNSDYAESDDESLVFASLSLRFLSASQILFDSNYAAHLLMKQSHFVRSCAACSKDSKYTFVVQIRLSIKGKS